MQTICDDQFLQKWSDTFRQYFVLFFVEWISTNSAEYFEVVEKNGHSKMLMLTQGTALEVSEVSEVSERVFEVHVVSDFWLCWCQRGRRTQARAHLLPKTNLPERHQWVLSAAALAALAPVAVAAAAAVAAVTLPAPVALFHAFIKTELSRVFRMDFFFVRVI